MFSIKLPHPKITQQFGCLLSKYISNNDIILLFGNVGVGKSEIVRGYIRKIMNDHDYIVCSPTFMIEQQYKIPKTNNIIHHVDLYRINPQEDYLPLDFTKEWAEHLDKKILKNLPNRLEISLYIDKNNNSNQNKQKYTLEDEEYDYIGNHKGTIKSYGTWNNKINQLIEEFNKQY